LHSYPNDQKFSNAFDAIFESECIHVIVTPFQAPNAYAECWVRTVREECLDHILILNTHHLKRVLLEYSDYNTCRPHQGINQGTPIPHQAQSFGTIRRRKVLGGIINDHYRSPSLINLPSS
jgi:hypothetical protein